MMGLAAAVLAAFLAVMLASLVEYVVHRLMHAGKLRGQRHAEHHRDGWGQGFWPEFRDYLWPGFAPAMLPAWLLGPGFGTGWCLGLVGYAAFVAYAHQLQHENPAACRWMPMPVHYVHHRDHMWQHNFGLAVDWWDRVFGTYKRVPFGSELPPELAQRGAFDIHWKATTGEGQLLATRSATLPRAEAEPA
jgi:sterol desaturase/sphingolipid hydroxylase (fatty acid hydroxylase superfamily)